MTQQAKFNPSGQIAKILGSKAKHGFIPSPNFYEKIGVKRKRWGQLVRDEVSPTLLELSEICDYFEFDISQFIS